MCGGIFLSFFNTWQDDVAIAVGNIQDLQSVTLGASVAIHSGSDGQGARLSQVTAIPPQNVSFVDICGVFSFPCFFFLH